MTTFPKKLKYPVINYYESVAHVRKSTKGVANYSSCINFYEI